MRKQLGHLAAMRERLSPADREIAQAAMWEMDETTRAQWLATLSSMSVDEATDMVRSLIADIRAATSAGAPASTRDSTP